MFDGFIVDYYCHAAAVIVEVDGGVHEGQAEYDAGRDEILSLRGFRSLRLRNEEVEQDLDGVLARIAAACERGT